LGFWFENVPSGKRGFNLWCKRNAILDLKYFLILDLKKMFVFNFRWRRMLSVSCIVAGTIQLFKMENLNGWIKSLLNTTLTYTTKLLIEHKQTNTQFQLIKTILPLWTSTEKKHFFIIFVELHKLHVERQEWAWKTGVPDGTTFFRSPKCQTKHRKLPYIPLIDLTKPNTT
jgi:hypothetical protein